jgi:hypothetical protein
MFDQFRPQRLSIKFIRKRLFILWFKLYETLGN